MTDEELIDGWERGDEWEGTEVELNELNARIIALARIGARVTALPREIYEAANAIANFRR